MATGARSYFKQHVQFQNRFTGSQNHWSRPSSLQYLLMLKHAPISHVQHCGFPAQITVLAYSR